MGMSMPLLDRQAGASAPLPQNKECAIPPRSEEMGLPGALSMRTFFEVCVQLLGNEGECAMIDVTK